MSKDIHHHITPPPFAPIPPYDGHPHPFPHRHEAPRNHSARFRPMMLHPHIPHHFNFWCNKVIPLAYDDSLSYYEVLAKVADYLNNMLNDEKMMMINIEELAQAFCELQGFVNDYFAFYQSKGIINFEAAITNDNYLEILPDADNAQMNTVYRMQFVEGSTQNVPANLPESAKPYNHEAVLFNLSNFVVKRVGNEWLEITDDNKEYSTKGNYQLFITGKDIYFRENNGDTWGEWNSIFANWWASEYENVKTWVREYVTPLITDINTRLTAEIERATAAEQALDDKIEAETDRATAAEQALDDKIEAETDRSTTAEQGLSQRLVAEYERAAAKESELEQAIEDETDRAEAVEGNLQTAIQNEVTRATGAEGAIRTALNAEITRATTRENEINSTISDVATDLSEEILDRQQGDENLSDSIAAETARAENAEQAIRDGYIPNGGNEITSGDSAALTVTRNGITLKSYNTTISSGVTSSVPNSTIVVQPSTVTLDAGNNTTRIQVNPVNAVITQNSGGSIQLSVAENGTTQTSVIFTGSGFNQTFSGGSVNWDNNGVNFNINNMATFNMNSSGIFISGYANGSINNSVVLTGDRIVLQHSGTNANSAIQITGGSGHLLREGVSSPTANTEIVIKGDLSAYATNDSVSNGYIPNAGNVMGTTDFTLTRQAINIHALGSVNFDSAGNITLSSDGGFDVLCDDYFKVSYGNYEIIYGDNNGVKISDGRSTFVDTGVGTNGYATIQGSSAIKMAITSNGNEVLYISKNTSAAHDKYIIRICEEKLLYNTLNDSPNVFGTDSVFTAWVGSLNTRARHNMVIANKEFDDVDGTFNFTGSRDTFDVPIIWENCDFELSSDLIFTNGKHIFKNCKFNSDDTQTIRDIFISGTAPVHVEFINCSFYNCDVNVADSYNSGNNTTRFAMDGCYSTSTVNIRTSDIGGSNVVKRIMNCTLNKLNYTCTVTGAGKDVIVCGNRIVEYHSLGVGEFDTLFWYNNTVLNQP